jgi:hypothetical protein
MDNKKLYLVMVILLNISCDGVAQSQQYLSPQEIEQIYEENVNRCMDQGEYKQPRFVFNAMDTPIEYCQEQAESVVQTIMAKEYNYW